MNTKTKNIILLIIRILVGGMLAWAGLQKLMNADMVSEIFANNMGLSTPIFWAVALGEFLAGLGVLFGVYTQVAAAGVAIIMAGAVYYSKGQMDAILLLVGSLVLIYTGSGSYACKPCKTGTVQNG